MSSEGSDVTLDDAEADAFWCLYHVVKMLPGGTADDAGLPSKARRLQLLLQAYDPAVADLLTSHNLGELLATRISVALCTRVGLTLRQCAQVWDRFLADPRRFEFSDYFVVALMLSKRRLLLRGHQDAGSVAEAVLAAPAGDALVESLLRAASAICALERRCGPSSDTPFPLRPGVLGVVATVVRESVGSLWGQLRVRGAGALQGIGRRSKGDALAAVPRKDNVGSTLQSREGAGYGAVGKCGTIIGGISVPEKGSARRAVSLDRTALEAGLV
jgi:hypothetical protein